ncbi:MAG: ATP-dependent RecD-like DNA helicase [Deltaproteobacteria bacterium]|nr:ATP-dependent RecD-like DNA helicase [Deltaproteobacteria bacterium]
MARGSNGAGNGPDPAPDVVEGDVDRITYEDAASGFRVLRVTDRHGQVHTVVGRMQAISVGTRVRATGKFDTDPRHGRQLKASTLLTLEPDTLKGLERLIGSGLASGIGPTFAQRIVQHFGTSTLRILDEHPERLLEVTGLGRKRAEKLSRAWSDQKATREVMVFLQGFGISPALAQRIFRRYGPKAILLVKENPYRLATDIWGVGFKKADDIAQAIGIARDAPERIRAAVLHVIDQASERGHVFVPRVGLGMETRKIVDVDEDLIEQAIDDVAGSEHARTEVIDEIGTVIYSARLHAAEIGLAKSLARLCGREARGLDGAEQAIGAFEHRTGTTLAEAQRQAIRLAATSRVLVITGGPGVGKTTIVRALIELFDRASLSVRLAAPTGRASRRMEEATGRASQTLHRLLDYQPRNGGFAHNEDNPLELDVLIVDECSMLDLPLAHALVRAIPPKARLVLVGDVDQLPSIGPGAVLRDIIESRAIPTIRLVEIFRQAAASRIVSSAHRILDGRIPESSSKGESGGDFFVVTAADAQDAAGKVRQLVVERIPKSFSLDPVRQVQVLTPMHRGPAGSEALNRALQDALNPASEANRSPMGFRIGDKVMQLRNDYGRDVFNGDIGFVSAVDPEERTLIVDLEGRQVAYEESQLDELTLAYACSIHKSQGSEYPAVVIPMLSAHFVMLSRNLLYTAVTRGKRLVVLITDRYALRVALDETRREERYTWLGRRLSDAVNGTGMRP